MMWKPANATLVFTTLVTASFNLGCGYSDGIELGQVTGRITINDEPVPGVRVVFVPLDDGTPSYGGTDDDGVYRLVFSQNRDGAMVGEHTVLIENKDPVTDDSGKAVDSTPIVKVPQKYRRAGILTADVSSGKNQVDFELDAK